MGLRMRMRSAALLLALVVPSLPALGASVVLRSSASVEAGSAVRLSDIARITGDGAASLGEVEILAAGFTVAGDRPWIEVPVEEVRAALARAGSSGGSVALSGLSCTVRIVGGRAQEPLREAERAGEAGIAAPVDGSATCRARALAALAALFGCDESDLRATFEAQDEEFLSAARHGRRIVAQPASGPGSARVLLAVRVFDGERIVDSRTVRARVEVRRVVVVVKREFKRREELSSHDLKIEERWIDPGGGALVEEMAEADGSRARSRLVAGSILRREHLETAAAVRKNELVTVHAVRAGFEVRSRARARQEGRVGERIEVRADGSKRSFTARVQGPGVVVVDMDALGERSESEGGS